MQNPDYGLRTHCSEIVQASEAPKHRTHSYTTNDKSDLGKSQTRRGLPVEPAGWDMAAKARPCRLRSDARVSSETFRD